jgi:hypothetical protein
LFCGDGITQQPQEICDRGNRGCGACNAGCNAVISEQATGLILASGAGTYTVGDRFTLGDGVISPLVFELTTTGTIGSGRLPVLFLGTASAAQVAGKIAEAIGNTTLHISTRVVGGAVLLTHQRPTTTGNVLIVPTVATASTLVVDGMSGGQGGQCLGAQPCKDDRECASNNCSGELCVAP